jgi:hypothetical protein
MWQWPREDASVWHKSGVKETANRIRAAETGNLLHRLA